MHSLLVHKLPATDALPLTQRSRQQVQGFQFFFIHHPVTPTGPSNQVVSIVTGGSRCSLHTVMYKSYGWAVGPMPSLILGIVETHKQICTGRLLVTVLFRLCQGSWRWRRSYLCQLGSRRVWGTFSFSGGDLYGASK